MLEDLLAEDLALVVCGSAAGRRSAELKQYYAGPGNKFWRTLARTGLTPRPLSPPEWRLLLDFGIGLTDLVKQQSGGDREIDFRRAGAAELERKIARLRPGFLCFNGKRAASEYLGRRQVAFGLQPERIADTRIFIAPSTSGAANGSWDPARWDELAALVRALRLPGSRTRASYDAIAERFRDRTSDRTRMREALDRFAARVGDRGLVLDIGAGPGADSAELRQRGLRVISLDLSLGMLRSGLRDNPGPRVQADMARLPFHSIAAGLWVNASLLHVERERTPAVLRELRRVLVDSGTLYVSLKLGTNDLGTNDGWETARYGDEHPRWFTYWTPEALDAALISAGFRILEAELREGTQDTWLVRSCTPARAAT